ncbi:hypothetical protein PRZ48_005139 [Zasmidium cellare]|uniref:Methyltransferase n=1 Tax=Zasmidium cellare TaxID=395010 RepID=A0ABR0ET17_ZASCE|nr:hypothetical protein PRZ48_005139 [Zasmidium cellare]
MAIEERAQFKYFRWEDKFAADVKPYFAMMDLPEGFPHTNFEGETGPVEHITDIRHDPGAYDLDQNGFVIREHVLRDQAFDEAGVADVYLPKMEKLIKDELGNDWARTDLDDKSIIIEPVVAVHVGSSSTTSFHQTQANTDDQISVWRPIENEVDEWPLAMLDGSTIPNCNLINIDHVRRTYVGETQYAVHSPEYRWHYLSRQKKDEVIIMKMYDSAQDVPAKCCPRAAFQAARVVENAKPRETIEVRALVFSDY